MWGAFSITLACSGSVTASCGSYLFKHGMNLERKVLPSDSLLLMQAEGMSRHGIPLEIPVRHCSGPNCSSSPLPLAPIPVVPVNPIRGSVDAIVLQRQVEADSCSRHNQIPQSERGAFFEPSSIFRPPA